MSPRLRAVVALATTVAFWPVWRWYAARMADGSDEKWGLLAVACAVALALTRRTERRVDPPLLPLAGLVVMGGLLPVAVPALVRAVPALVAVAVVTSTSAFGRRFHPGTAALLLLALPVEATLQFFLGYPLRWAATGIAACVLQAGGLPVTPQATLLAWRGEAIGVDAACSGVHMMWVSLFLVAVVGAVRDFGIGRLVAGGLAAAVVVTVTNGLRVAALFVKEARVVPAPEWTHEVVGLVLFAGAVALLMGVLGRLEPRPRVEPAEAPATPPRPVAIPAYVAACVAVAAIGGGPRAGAIALPAVAFPGWPQTLDGAALQPVPLQAADERFARSFPGRLARFTDGRRAVLVRWLPRPTRQLHPATDCFRGSGFTTVPGPARVDSRGQRWSCFAAGRASERYEVCERIFDETGGSWTDTSAWWWAAALGRGQGPWWAVTVVEPRV